MWLILNLTLLWLILIIFFWASLVLTLSLFWWTCFLFCFVYYLHKMLCIVIFYSNLENGEFDFNFNNGKFKNFHWFKKCKCDILMQTKKSNLNFVLWKNRHNTFFSLFDVILINQRLQTYYLKTVLLFQSIFSHFHPILVTIVTPII